MEWKQADEQTNAIDCYCFSFTATAIDSPENVGATSTGNAAGDGDNGE